MPVSVTVEVLSEDVVVSVVFVVVSVVFVVVSVVVGGGELVIVVKSAICIAAGAGSACLMKSTRSNVATD